MIRPTVINYRTLVTFLISVLFGFALTKIFPLLNKHPQMMVALPFVGAFFLMLVVNPRATFCLIFLFRPLLDRSLDLTKINLGGQDIGLGAILNLIVIFMAVFLYFYEGSFPRRNPVIRCWAFFLFVMLIAALESPMFGKAIRLFANYLSYFGMFLIPFLIIKSKEDFNFWVKVFAWSFVLPVMYANVDFLMGGKFYADAGVRILGSFSHPNVLAFYLCLGITYYFYVLKSGIFRFNPPCKLVICMFILNMIFLLIATKTRNAWIALFGVVFVYGCLKDRKMLFCLFLSLPLLMFVPAIKDRVVTLQGGHSELNYKGMNSLEWRLRMWKSSFPYIAKRPVQGYGLSTFVPMSANFSDVGKNAAHNMYIETLFESGFVGLAALLILLFAPLKYFYKQMQKSCRQYSIWWAIIVSYLISYIIICFADNLSYYLVFNWYVWFYIGLMMVARKYMDPSVSENTSAAV